MLLSAIAIMVYLKIDLVMIGQILDDEQVGIYSAAARISEVWYFIPVIIVASLYPSILDAKKFSEDMYYQRLQSLYDFMVWLAISVALIVSFIATPLIDLLFGQAYEMAGDILMVHIWSSIFVFLGVASGKWYLTEGLLIINFQRAFLGALTNILLNFLLIPSYGIHGAAWATVISFALSNMFFDAIQKRTFKVFKMKLLSFNLIRIVKFYL